MSHLRDTELEMLREENSILREENRQLNELLLPPKQDFSVMFGLTPQESTIFSVLISADGGIVSKDKMMSEYVASSTNTDSIPQVKILDVFICKIRKKLKQWDISIQTSWGQGWYITREDRTKALEIQSNHVM